METSWLKSMSLCCLTLMLLTAASHASGFNDLVLGG